MKKWWIIITGIAMLLLVLIRLKYTGSIILHGTVKHNCYTITHLLLKLGANPDGDIENDGDTPLFEATSNHNKEIVILLLKYKADPDIIRPSGYHGCITVLHKAIEVNDVGITKILIERRASINIAMLENINLEYATPLFEAVEVGNIDIVKMLLAHGAVVDDGGFQQQTPAQLAAKKGLMKILQLLLTYGADKEKAIKSAVSGDRVEIVKYLINTGNYSYVGHYVPSATSVKMLKYLLACGANINDRDKIGRTLLHTVVSDCNLRMVQYVLQNGANANIRDFDGNTPLDISIPESDIAKYIKKYGGKHGKDL